MRTNNTENPAYLFVSPPRGERFAIELEANNSVFVGTGPNCRVVLQGSSVEQIHCMFWLSEKRVLRVQDWNTRIGTLVNGQPVDAETIVSSGDELEIDGNRIVPVLTQEDHQQISSQLGNQEMQVSMTKTLQPEPAAVAEPALEQPQLETEPEQFKYDAMAGLDGNADVGDELASPYDVAVEFDESAFGHSQLVDSQLVESQNEELELLRMEVDELRFELAQRDHQITPLADATEDVEPFSVDDDQTIQLVNRLEDLLEELQTSDERVRGLEELLTASDQATQHEREERQQLESWVMEIEQRLSQRESESSAEMDRLVKRLNDSKAQHQHAAIQLKKVLQSKATGQGGIPNEVVDKLRDQIEDLQQRLSDSQSENDQLRQSSSEETSASVEFQQMEQKLLQMQVETSRERADMSRQRAELEKLKDQLETKLSSAKKMGNADTRVQAIRQHLREIHDEEQIAIEEKRQRSLSGRISRLLSRVSS